jgi:hypothetical protein
MKIWGIAGYMLILTGCSSMAPIQPHTGVTLAGQPATAHLSTPSNTLWSLPTGGWVKFNAAGRLIATGQLQVNVLHHTNLSADPLWQLPRQQLKTPWIAQIDWDQTHRSGYARTSTFTAPRPLHDAQGVIQQWYVQEHVKAGQYQWENEFWWDNATGQLIKSRQRISPQGNWVEWQHSVAPL